MNVDERIEALTARHEALTMNPELAWHEIEAQRETSVRIYAEPNRLFGGTKCRPNRFRSRLQIWAG